MIIQGAQFSVRNLALLAVTVLASCSGVAESNRADDGPNEGAGGTGGAAPEATGGSGAAGPPLGFAGAGNDDLIGACVRSIGAGFCGETYLSDTWEYDSSQEVHAYQTCRGSGTEDTWTEDQWLAGEPCPEGPVAACRSQETRTISYSYENDRRTMAEREEGCTSSSLNEFIDLTE